ncbi:hypothetical protein B0H14DRAFT_3424168 [Mycena olivaceomarginata]|nr:hypothetical protein B0H14DRAFT_3424168 [Mycena olivaceomarginata]
MSSLRRSPLLFCCECGWTLGKAKLKMVCLSVFWFFLSFLFYVSHSLSFHVAESFFRLLCVLRTQRTPSRHSPYRRGHHSRPSRGGGENFNPIGPGHPGDFDTQYPAYNGNSSAGYRMPFAPVHNYEPSRRLSLLTTAVNIDELSTQYGLDSAQRKAAHDFSKLGGENRAITMFLRLLGMEQQNKRIEQKIDDTRAHVQAIGTYCMQNWRPSKQQIKLLKSLLRHYIIRPLTSYSNLIPIVQTYIHDHAKRLHLELYKQDPTVKAFVHDLLAVENNAVRSAIRKAEKTDLETFSKKIVNGYHLPTIPSTPPKDIMACLALMRQVARPLAKKASTRGGDTGFWTNLEAELDDLFEKNGNNRDDSKWHEWEQDIIDADNRRYLRRGAESNARTQEEIDAAVLVGPASGSATVAASAPAAAPGSDGEDGDAQGLEERDVTIPALGDLAALSVGPVVRDS